MLLEHLPARQTHHAGRDAFCEELVPGGEAERHLTTRSQQKHVRLPVRSVGEHVATAREAAERGVEVRILSDCQCLCTTMYRIDLPHLCWVLENLLEGKVVNEIRVDAHTRKWATVALERMLAIKGTGNPIGKQQPVGTTVD